MPPHHHDALVDRCMLAQVDVLRLVRGQHSVDMEALGKCKPLTLTGGRRERYGRVNHRQGPIDRSTQWSARPTKSGLMEFLSRTPSDQGRLA